MGSLYPSERQWGQEGKGGEVWFQWGRVWGEGLGFGWQKALQEVAVSNYAPTSATVSL